MAESLIGLHSVLLFDQRDRWSKGDRPKIEAYLELLPELGFDHSRLLDIIYQEVYLRKAIGETPTLEEYLARFPKLSDDLRLQFEVDLSLDWSEVDSIEVSAPRPLPNIDGYRVESVLGSGAFGWVYKAWEYSLKRYVAIKLLPLTGAQSKEAADLYGEAQTVASLTHPNIVQIHAVGHCNEGIYFSQELVEEGTLADYIPTHRCSPRESANLMITLADAVHYAHLCRVIHCDLKPANILLKAIPRSSSEPSSSGLDQFVAKISDFGLCRSLDPEHFVESRHLTGTLHYMAPEQTGIEGAVISPASDVYSLGAILYELLSGRPPHSSDSKLEAFLKLRREVPVPPKVINPSTPSDLNAICMKCLAICAKDRYESAAALSEDLKRYLNGLAPKAISVGLIGHAMRWAVRKPAVAILAVMLCLVSVIGMVAVTANMLIAQAAERREQKRANELDAALYRNQFRLAAMAAETGDIRRARHTLDQTNPAQRSIEWSLVDSRLKTLGHKLPFSGRDVTRMVVSQTGRWLAVGEGTDSTLLLDTGSKYESIRLPGSHANVWHPPVFNSDDSYIATSILDDNRIVIRLWNIHQGKEERKIGPLTGNLVAFGFTKDDQQLVTVGWVDARQLPSVTAIKWTDSENLSQPVFGGGLTQVKLADRLTIERWEVASGKRLSGVIGPKIDQVFTPLGAIDPSSHYLAWTTSTALKPKEQSQTHLIDLEQGKEQWTLQSHKTHLQRLCFSPDSRILATYSEDGHCILWDAATGKELRRIADHRDAITSVVFSRDGRLIATAGNDFNIQVSDVQNGQIRKILHGASDMIRSIAFSADGNAVFGIDAKDALARWELNSQEAIHVNADGVTRITFDEFQKGLYVASIQGDLKHVTLNGVNQDSQPRNQVLVTDDCLEFAISSQNLLAVIKATDKSIQLRELLKQGQEVDIEKLPEASPNGDRPLTWSADGSVLAYIQSDRKRIRVVNVRAKATGLDCSAGDAKILAMDVSDNYRIAACCDDRQIRIWDQATGRLMQTIYCDQIPRRLAFRPHSNEIAVVHDSASDCQIWDAASGKRRMTIEGHKRSIRCLTYTADGSRLITGGDDRLVSIADADSGEELLTLNVDGPVERLVVDRENRQLAITCMMELSNMRSVVLVYGAQGERRCR